MSRPLLSQRLQGLGTSIFAEMSARAAADAIQSGQGSQHPPFLAEHPGL
jgi:hypothetical protein